MTGHSWEAYEGKFICINCGLYKGSLIIHCTKQTKINNTHNFMANDKDNIWICKTCGTACYDTRIIACGGDLTCEEVIIKNIIK